jgi:hypothetical protein
VSSVDAWLYDFLFSSRMRDTAVGIEVMEIDLYGRANHLTAISVIR